MEPHSLRSFSDSTSAKHPYEIITGVHMIGEGETTSGVTTLNKTPYDLFDTPFIRKVDYYPLRNVSGLIVLLIPHVPLAGILKGVRETSATHKDGKLAVDSVLPSPKVIPRDGSLRAGIWMGRELISAFNPDLGKLPAHSAFGSMSIARKRRGPGTYPCGFNGSEAVGRFSRRPL